MYFSKNKNGLSLGKEYNEKIGGALQLNGNIVYPEIMLTDTLANTLETEKTIAYPSGFNIDNCFIECFKIEYNSSNHQIKQFWADVYLMKDGVHINPLDNLAVGKKIKIILKKIE